MVCVRQGPGGVAECLDQDRRSWCRPAGLLEVSAGLRVMPALGPQATVFAAEDSALRSLAWDLGVGGEYVQQGGGDASCDGQHCGSHSVYGGGLEGLAAEVRPCVVGQEDEQGQANDCS